MSYFSIHNHSDYSNIRLLDSVIKVETMINRSLELGLKGVCLTDHESLGGHVAFLSYYNKIKAKNPDFKIGLGNEIYLTKTRTQKQKYYHFLLLAKNDLGHRALRELSSTSWYNMYKTGKNERVPTLYSELEAVIKKYPNTLIASTACLGSEFAQEVLTLIEMQEASFSIELINFVKERIHIFVKYMIELFGKDFYIEIAPSENEEQIKYNRLALVIANAYGVKTIVATDSHYIKKEQKLIHKAYITSKEGDRETDGFYDSTYLMSREELYEYLKLSFDSEDEIDSVINNTLEIYNKIEGYNFFRKPIIPREEVRYYPKNNLNLTKYPSLNKMNCAESDQQRYWVNTIVDVLKKKKLDIEEYYQRLNTEADVILHISDVIQDDLTAYFNSIQYYIQNYFWQNGTIVGPGRGSAVGFLSNYLLEITQIDPVRYNLPWFRFLNKERVELPDIDLDIAPSKRPQIFTKIREHKGELNLLQIAAYGTEGTKSTILTACRGYRSEEYPDGLDPDYAQYLTGFISAHRGFLWPLKDVVYGNPEEDRAPVHDFIKEVSQYEGLLEIMFAIEGLVNKRSVHASGVVLYNGDPLETTAVMRTSSGELITQFSLHDAEKMGDTKFDFLATEVCDKILETIRLLQKDGAIDPSLSVKEVYNKYLHPEVLDLSDSRIWTALGENAVLDAFQFNTPVGSTAAKMVKPKNIAETTAANALMRLMGERGQETPLEKYVKHKENIAYWYLEMSQYGLTEDEVKAIKKHYEKDYGVPPYQESIMLLLIDPAICGFTLGEANSARSVVSKKKMAEIPALKEKVFSKATSENLARYIWDTCIAPQLGYGFSELHSLAYSFVGIQTIYLATNFHPVYWSTACLIVNAGVVQPEEEEEDDSGEEEYIPSEDPEEEIVFLDNETGEIVSAKKNKTKTTDYAKLAIAMGTIIKHNINISKPQINHSNYNFEPDVQNNQILFGLNCITKIGKDIISDIIKYRPYSSIEDFMIKVKAKKPAMINLIKGGAFDELYPNLLRSEIMALYIRSIAGLKRKLTLQNAPGLIEAGLIPDIDGLDFVKQVFAYTKVLKSNFVYIKDGVKTDFFILNDENVLQFFTDNFDTTLLQTASEGYVINKKIYDVRIYQPVMNILRTWLMENHEAILQEYNNKLFQETWDSNCGGNIGKWEMDSISFYYHDHELIHVQKARYGIVDFESLPSEAVVEKYIPKKGQQIPIYKLSLVCGTVISKDKTSGIVHILTVGGSVVAVRFRKEHFAIYNKQVSITRDDGTKQVVEKSWFQRGNKILVTGYRRDDVFVPKTYARTTSHTLYIIDDIKQDGSLELRSERVA